MSTDNSKEKAPSTEAPSREKTSSSTESQKAHEKQSLGSNDTGTKGRTLSTPPGEPYNDESVRGT